MKKTKKELKRTIEILERQKFLDVYSEFTKWLYSLKFRPGHYWKESATPMDNHYSHYEKHIDSLYSVEHYIHDGLNLSIRFLRDRYEHKFMFVGDLGSHSKTYTVEEVKEIILNEMRRLRDELSNNLSLLNYF